MRCNACSQSATHRVMVYGPNDVGGIDCGAVCAEHAERVSGVGTATVGVVPLPKDARLHDRLLVQAGLEPVRPVVNARERQLEHELHDANNARSGLALSLGLIADAVGLPVGDPMAIVDRIEHLAEQADTLGSCGLGPTPVRAVAELRQRVTFLEGFLERLGGRDGA